MNINLQECLIYGIKNPKVKVIGSTDCKINDIVIIIDNKKYKYNDKEVNLIDNIFKIQLQLKRNIKNIKIYIISKNGKQLVFNKNYGYFIRFIKIITKPFRVIYNRLKLIFKPIFKTIRLMWERHHFLIPPSLFKRYFNSFISNYTHPEIETYYNPEDINDYNKWLKSKNDTVYYNELDYKPLFSVIIPVYNVEPSLLDECINSVLNQKYENFEICICDDCSPNKKTINALKKYEKNPKIKIMYSKKNGMISKCMNNALSLAKGDYVGFLDNDDILTEDALYQMALKLNNDDLDLIYSDEDKIDENGRLCDPFFKPDYSPDTLMSMNYFCHFTIIKKSILDKVGNFNSKFDGAQDYDLFLRVTENTNKIGHVAKVLYHWRKSETSTAAKSSNKNYAYIAGKKALEEALKRRNIKGEVIEKVPFYQIKYLYDKEPKISIIIPTKDHKDVLEKCVESILDKTIYKNYEIIIVDNNTTDDDALKYIEGLKKNKKIKIYEDHGEFNYSKINNDAIRKTNGEYVLLLNNDTEVITPDWLNVMVGYASQSHIGTVGAKLIYPDETIQHGGVILGNGGVAVHAYCGFPKEEVGYYGRLYVPYNYSANTAACLMISREKFEEVNGLEEDLKVAYNDVDFNIKLLEKGYYNIFLPQVELYHFESKSRGLDTKGEKKIRFEKESDYMKNKWKTKLMKDKFYNYNFSRTKNFCLERFKK